MGNRAVKILINVLKHKKIPKEDEEENYKKQIIETHLIERESTLKLLMLKNAELQP
jgi:LacI family transcriptional regulator